MMRHLQLVTFSTAHKCVAFFSIKQIMQVAQRELDVVLNQTGDADDKIHGVSSAADSMLTCMASYLYLTKLCYIRI